MNQIDPEITLGLAKKAPKMNIMSILLLLQNMTSADKGLVQIKNAFEDTL